MNGSERWESLRFSCFDTVNEIRILHRDRTPLMRSAALCGRSHRLFSRFLPDSDLYRISHSGGAPVRAAAETLELLALAEYYRAATGGAFTPAAGTLSELWGFGGTPAVPPPEQCRRAAQAVRGAVIELSGTTVRCPAGVVLDVGGIAKGYAADKVARLLAEEGVVCGMIDLGGNLLSVGGRPDGGPWRFGVRSPFQRDSLCAVIFCAGGWSAVTSGGCERWFEQDGRRYGHIIDPRTGMPAERGLAAVTVLSRSSTAADALATAFFCLGVRESLALLPRFPGTEALFIRTDGSYFWSGRAEQLEWLGARKGEA